MHINIDSRSHHPNSSRRITMVSFSLYRLSLYALLASFSVTSVLAAGRVLAGPIGKDCITDAKYNDTPVGKNITIAGVPTYASFPKHSFGKKDKVILHFSDVFGPFHTSNFILIDYFATQGEPELRPNLFHAYGSDTHLGFHVYGIDYFLGDPIGDHINDPNFNQTEWLTKSRKQAEDTIPKWTAAILAKHGE